MSAPEDMWQCQTLNCGYIYDPDRGDRKGKIPKGVKFEDLPEGWKCPVCGASKAAFKPLAGPGSVMEEQAGGAAPAAQVATSASEGGNMQKYRCEVCGYVYDPAQGDSSSGIAAGTPFDKLPDDWVCPICGAGKDQFEAQ